MVVLSYVIVPEIATPEVLQLDSLHQKSMEKEQASGVSRPQHLADPHLH
jgi:hypothetical protein